jgi:ribosomal protein S8
MGVAILSTPKGVMSAEDAVKQKLGGEYLCQIY